MVIRKKIFYRSMKKKANMQPHLLTSLLTVSRVGKLSKDLGNNSIKEMIVKNSLWAIKIGTKIKDCKKEKKTKNQMPLLARSRGQIPNRENLSIPYKSHNPAVLRTMVFQTILKVERLIENDPSIVVQMSKNSKPMKLEIWVLCLLLSAIVRKEQNLPHKDENNGTRRERDRTNSNRVTKKMTRVVVDKLRNPRLYRKKRSLSPLWRKSQRERRKTYSLRKDLNRRSHEVSNRTRWTEENEPPQTKLRTTLL